MVIFKVEVTPKSVYPLPDQVEYKLPEDECEIENTQNNFSFPCMRESSQRKEIATTDNLGFGVNQLKDFT